MGLKRQEKELTFAQRRTLIRDIRSVSTEYLENRR